MLRAARARSGAPGARDARFADPARRRRASQRVSAGCACACRCCRSRTRSPRGHRRFRPARARATRGRADRICRRAQARRACHQPALRRRRGSFRPRPAATAAAARTSPPTCARYGASRCSLRGRQAAAAARSSWRGLHDARVPSRPSTASAAEQGEKIFVNPRNAAAGQPPPARPEDHGEARARSVFYGVGRRRGLAGCRRARARMLAALREFGSADRPRKPRSWTASRAASRTIDAKIARAAQRAAYDIDGVVYKVDRARLAARARVRRASSALGDRAQVPGAGGDDDVVRDGRVPGRTHRGVDAGRAARAGVRRRCHREQRDAAQHGRARAQGRADRRHGRRATSGRRDSGGGPRGHRSGGRRTHASSSCRRSARSAARRRKRGRRGGRALHRRTRLRGAAPRVAAAFRLAQGDGHRRTRRPIDRAAGATRAGANTGGPLLRSRPRSWPGSSAWARARPRTSSPRSRAAGARRCNGCCYALGIRGCRGGNGTGASGAFRLRSSL